MANDAELYTLGQYLDLQGAEQKIGDVDSMREMLGMLEELLIKDIPAIVRALDSGDLAGAGALLHSLKGCMPIFCRPDICDSVVAAERAAKMGHTIQAEETFAALHPALEQLRMEIRHYLANP